MIRIFSIGKIKKRRKAYLIWEITTSEWFWQYVITDGDDEKIIALKGNCCSKRWNILRVLIISIGRVEEDSCIVVVNTSSNGNEGW